MHPVRDRGREAIRGALAVNGHSLAGASSSPHLGEKTDAKEANHRVAATFGPPSIAENRRTLGPLTHELKPSVPMSLEL